jgi:hypothetical protein
MTTNPQGTVTMQVDGATYRLHFGMSVAADIQARFGEAFDDLISGRVKDGALPDFKMVHAMLAGALERYHADKACDRFFVDDLIAQNPTALTDLVIGSSPDASAEGKAKARRR